MNLRARLGRRVVLGTATVSRLLRRGGGSMIGGRLGLAVDPTLLKALAHGREIALVSGTNGKTTTTRLFTEALGGPAAVATSLAGANMPAGLVTALANAAPQAPGVLEIDENYLPLVIKEIEPAVVVLLNLSRDQLDRVSEVRMIANKWRTALSASSATVVANADDPLVVWAAGLATSVIWVGAGGAWHDDAFHCPSCDKHITYVQSDNENIPDEWSCSCGFARPEPDAWLSGESVTMANDVNLALNLAIPGRFNRANALMAAIGASAFDKEIAVSLEKMSTVSNVAGRFHTVDVGGCGVRLLLAKNPAGWNELIELIRDDNSPTIIAINAQDADGNDPSWLWDVAFERLAGRTVLAAGERRYDLAVRLRHGGVAHEVVDDAVTATTAFSGETIDFIGNYTAFQSYRRAIVGHQQNLAMPQKKTTPAMPVVTSVSSTHQRRQPAPDLTVVNLFPDLLGTYGDGGNGRIVANRALWRGLTVELIDAPSNQPLPTSADIYCLGGGEDGPQLHAAECLQDGKLNAAVEHGAVVLAICAGFQIVGETFSGIDQIVHKGAGLLDVVTTRGKGPRAVGEVRAVPLDPRLDPAITLNGFENHGGHTHRGEGVAAFAKVTLGRGNGVDGTDGAVSGKVIGTYLHGPLLARNPTVADLLICLVTGTELSPIDDREELALHADRLKVSPSRRPKQVVRRLPVLNR